MSVQEAQIPPHAATRRDNVNRWVEDPYFKLLTRGAMLFVTLAAAPVIGWTLKTLIDVTNVQSGLAIVQSQQQSQISAIQIAQAKIVDASAVEIQSRIANDSTQAAKIESLNDQVRNNTSGIEKLYDKIEMLYKDGLKR